MPGCQIPEENAAELQHEERRREILKVDRTLNAQQLDDKYNPNGGGEHPIYFRGDWQNEVGRGHTLLGYWDWVAHAIDEASLG